MTVAEQLVLLWDELERLGAVVNRVSLSAPSELLRARVAHERHRLQVLVAREAS